MPVATSRWWWVGIAFLALQVELGAQVESYADESAALDAAWIAQAEELAKWCGAHRLLGERDRLYAAILALDPEHLRARQTLRYVRVSGGAWRQSASYHPPRNRDALAMEELSERLEGAYQSYRSRVLLLVERHRAELGPLGVQGALEPLIAFAPEDATVRALLGEVRHGAEWVLAETACALERRHAIPFFARASLAAAPAPSACEPRPEELQLGLAWSAGRETPCVRVLATGSASEAEETARVSHALGEYFRSVFRTDGVHRPDLTIYLLADPSERERLLSAWPDLSEETRAALSRAAGGWLGTGNRVAQWSADPSRRLDGAARQTLGTILIDAFGIDGRSGWAWEGFGLYLVHAMLGTRQTWFFDGASYVSATSSGLWLRLQDPAVDWMEEGRLLLEGETAPHLAFLLGRDVNSMREEDLLFSYVLAAWLIEGRPADAVAISRRIGTGAHPVEAFEDVLDLTLPQIEARLRRWLVEMRGPTTQER